MRSSFPKSLRPLLLAVLLLLPTGRLFAQTPGWQWATSPGAGYGGSTAVDAAGNVYVTGEFSGTATFGATTLTSTGSADVFVAKLTSSGTYQWAVRAGQAGGLAIGNGVAVDGSGHVVVTGHFSGSARFGAVTLTSAGLHDVFVAQLTPAGAWQWAVRAGGTGYDEGADVAVGGSGQVVVAGRFNGTATIGDSAFSTTGNFQGFVAQLTPAGVWQWVNPVVGTEANCASVAVAGSGQVVVTGSFSGAVTFGAVLLISVGFTNVFVAQLTPTGTWQWATRAGGSVGVGGVGAGVGVAVAGSGQVVITGDFTGTVTFGATPLTSVGFSDVFVARLTPAGAWQWAVRAGTGSYNRGEGVAVDSSGHAVVTGNFDGTAAFGATTLTSAGSNDVFVARLTPAGAWQWAIGTGGSRYDAGFGVVVDSSGTVVVTGFFSSPAITFGATTLTNAGSNGIFLARLDVTTGLPEDPNQPGLTLSPNPARTTVQLTGATGPTATLLDCRGHEVGTTPLTQGAATLDVRTLPAGLYLLRAGAATRRLVVE